MVLGSVLIEPVRGQSIRKDKAGRAGPGVELDSGTHSKGKFWEKIARI